jgi:methylmalonyl-CoA/ethylmalonyl-CoA epimerase
MNATFHHIGVACRDLNSETNRFAALGYAPEGADFTDPIQGVSGRFLVGGGPRLELLVPLSTEGCLAPWLKTGAKLYHLAYIAPDFDGEILRLRGRGAKTVVQPVPAVAFAGRRITFLMLPNMMLVELISES